MSAKHSKEVTDRVRSGRHLLSAFEVEGPRVATSFLDETRPHSEEGDAEPRPGGFLVAVGRTLHGSLDHLVDADFAVVRAEGWESGLRKRFQDDKRELAFCIVALRRTVQGQFVEPDLPNLGLEAVNVRDGITILRRGELVGERFEAPNLAKMLGKPRFEKPADLSPQVAEVRRKSAALLALADEINEAHRASDRARIARSRAKEAYDRVYLRAARMFEDLCRFSGLDDLAARVRRHEGRSRAPVDSVTEALENTTGPEVPAEESREDERIRERSHEAVPAAAGGSDSAFDLRAPQVRARAEVPGPSDAAASPHPATHPELLSRPFRPLRRQRHGVQPERSGALGDRHRPGADRRPTRPPTGTTHEPSDSALPTPTRQSSSRE